nr:alpha/beta fold hydrolase [Longispora sp. (in: high G+C Gram-positive bacteria)]
MPVFRHPWRWLAVATVAVLFGGLGFWYLTGSDADHKVTAQHIDVNGVSLDTSWYAQTSGKAPTVLIAHGFGGSKDSVDASARELAAHGYNVLTWTARGFGRSGGEIHLGARDYEVRDAQGLIDWVATRASVILDGPGNPRLGVVGGSYGGALALNLAGVDSRVDAIVPQITYNDLSRALQPDTAGGSGVFSKAWSGVLFGAGLAPESSRVGIEADPQCGRFARDVCDAFLDTATTGVATEKSTRLLRSVSPVEVGGRISAPTLLIQGIADSLFPPVEADANAAAIRAGGKSTPVRVAWFSGGHDGGAGSEADAERVKFLTAQWLDHYLRHTGPAPGESFTYSRVTGVSVQERGVTTTGYKLSGYPGLTGSSDTSGAMPVSTIALALTGEPQRIASPPDRTPAAISVLPGLGSLVRGLATMELDGQHAIFESEPLVDPLDMLGTPRVRIKVASPTGEATLFAKLYDVGPNGQATLPNGLASPMRLTGLPASIEQAQAVTVSLPAVSLRLDVGHRLRLVLATSDQAYAGPVEPVVYTVALLGSQVDQAALVVPVAQGTPLASAESVLLIALAILLAAIILGVGATVV